MKVINMKYQDRVTVGDDVVIICPKRNMKVIIDAPRTKSITYYSAAEWAAKNRIEDPRSSKWDRSSRDHGDAGGGRDGD